MRCCVPNCKNDSKNLSKSEGITFHVFPTEPNLREAWTKALGRTNWSPKDKSAVCSQHFLPYDMYETRNGLTRVKSGAIPCLQDTMPLELKESSDLKICIICLSVNAKLYSMKKYKLDEHYRQLCSDNATPHLPDTLCIFCAKRLQNSAKLKSISITSRDLLNAVLKKDNYLSLTNIPPKVKQYNLTETVKDYFDYELDGNVQEIKTDVNDITINHPIEPVTVQEDHMNIDEVEIKEENNLDDITDNKDDYHDNENDCHETDNNCHENVKDCHESETNSHDNIDNCNDNDIPDFSDSSSCDIPINQLKKVKKKKPKKVKEKKVKVKLNEPKIDRRRKPFLNEDLNETLFTITDLSYEEQVAEIEKRQESSNYKNAVYRCTACYKGFLDEDAYDSHMVRHTNQSGEHECGICKTHFTHQHALRKHITAHHTQRFSCNCCVYVTTHRQTARLHERWHKGTKYKCPHCQDEFVKFTTYMGHIRIKHPSDFVCELCGYSFVSAKGIELHKKLKHRADNKPGHIRIKHPSDFVCELCGYSFVTAKGIELHKKLKHRADNQPISENSPYCEECNVRFATEEALKRHKLSRHTGDKDTKDTIKKPRKSREVRQNKDRRSKDHSPHDGDNNPGQVRKAEGPIPCEQCGLQLEDSRAYHGHFRRMHPDKNRTKYPSMKSPCMCEVCGRMFQSYALLKDHTWVHTGEKPFKCDLCNKSFRMKQRLVAHRRVHSSQRVTYSCHVCDKVFTTHSNRQRHMFIHTGLKPFKCEMCGKCFKHASEKRAHITYVHLKKPWPKRSRQKRNEKQDEDGTDLELGQSWACSDPKMNDIIDDKPMYYNLKI